MADQFITCPHCKKDFLLSQALTDQIKNTIQKDMETNFRDQLAAERRRVERNTRESLAIEIETLKQQVSEKDTALEESQRNELALRKKQRELEEREKTLELEINRRMDEERRSIQQEITERIAEESRAKDIENERQKTELRRQIDDLKRKAEQGSQQLQGESIELELEEILRCNFPYDQIAPVGKGIKGADIMQYVYSPTGQLCGSIIWEVKNTKLWSDGWIDKLKEDQRAAKAELAILVTIALPKDITHFSMKEGIWVADLSTYLSLATVLRASLIEVAKTKLALEGKSGKMEMLYSYLCGTEFRQKVEAIVDSFTTMQDDLHKERRAMETAWAKREKQLQNVIRNVGGMYGDMQGIVGASLPSIEALELPEQISENPE